MNRLQWAAVLSMIGLVVWTVWLLLSIWNVGLFEHVPWEIPAILLAIEAGWLMGAARMRPDLFEERDQT